MADPGRAYGFIAGRTGDYGQIGAGLKEEIGRDPKSAAPPKIAL